MSLVHIGYGHYLDAPAAEMYKRMLADGCPAGNINSSTRSYETQMGWYLNPEKYGLPGSVAHPDFSKHVYHPSRTDKGARALDLRGATLTWVRLNGHRYGFMKDRVSGEPWHIEFESWNVKITEDDVSATEVWSAAFGRDENRKTAGQLLAEARNYSVAASTKIDGLTKIINNLSTALNNIIDGESFDHVRFENSLEQIKADIDLAIKTALAEGASFDINVEVVPKN